MSTSAFTEIGIISPTLCEFFNLPFYTEMSEEEATIKIWNYILQNKLIIDERVIILDAAIHPVIHPYFIENHKNERDNCQNDTYHVEHSIIMVYVAKMHLDPTFIERDIQTRLRRIRMNIAARKILRSYKNKNNSTSNIRKSPNISNDWCQYLAKKYNKPIYRSHLSDDWYDAPQFD